MINKLYKYILCENGIENVFLRITGMPHEPNSDLWDGFYLILILIIDSYTIQTLLWTTTTDNSNL